MQVLPENNHRPRSGYLAGQSISKQQNNHNEPAVGSSPPMRGLRRNHLIDHFLRGIIPAHAGLTEIVISLSDFDRDHPRPCGAYIMQYKKMTQDWGSSPPMRGLLLQGHCQLIHPGIIPAHAGLTRDRHKLPSPARDHPRPCGAYALSGIGGG